jgi:hypothetical protein
VKRIKQKNQHHDVGVPGTEPPAELMPHSRRAGLRSRVVALDHKCIDDVLGRLDQGCALPASSESEMGPDPKEMDSALSPPAERRLVAVLGCKTSEVAMALLNQVVRLEHPNPGTDSDRNLNVMATTALAMLAELEPRTAAESLLAAQMVATQRLAMTFLERAGRTDQTVEGIDANVLRATRLMRVFNEQVEVMAKLKGKSGQQRVVVEHVSVTAGGQAIVGAINCQEKRDK